MYIYLLYLFIYLFIFRDYCITFYLNIPRIKFWVLTKLTGSPLKQREQEGEDKRCSASSVGVCKDYHTFRTFLVIHLNKSTNSFDVLINIASKCKARQSLHPSLVAHQGGGYLQFSWREVTTSIYTLPA